MTCYKKHEKKTEISDVVAAIVKNLHFLTFSENYENSQAKNPVDGKKKSQKLIFFKSFLEIWQNRIFHWEWANRREKYESSLSIFLYPSCLKKNVITLTISYQFWIKKLLPDPLDEICLTR